jgi:hypothetical protein
MEITGVMDAIMEEDDKVMALPFSNDDHTNPSFGSAMRRKSRRYLPTSVGASIRPTNGKFDKKKESLRHASV